MRIHEGRHKIVKRIFKDLGFYVKRLKRTRVGPVRIGRLKPGMVEEIPIGIIKSIMNDKKNIDSKDKPVVPRAKSFSKDKAKK